MADRHAAKPATRPALRSVPLVIRQPDTPSAMIKRTAVLLMRLRALDDEAKFGSRKVTTMAVMSIMKMMALLMTKFTAFLAVSLLAGALTEFLLIKMFPLLSFQRQLHTA